MAGNKIKFVLLGDIDFIAEAPSDITLEQLLKQSDRIRPDFGACGICSLGVSVYDEQDEVEIIIDYDSVKKANDDVECEIK